MIDIELFVWHPPPSEVELLPWSDVSDSGRESVMTLRPEEVLLDILSVVPVGDSS